MKKDPNALKPQDILMALKVLSLGRELWRHQDLSTTLFISQSEISMGLERLKMSGLIEANKKKILPRALLEFLIHGVKYAFPAILGPVARGIPTAHSAPPISHQIVHSKEDLLVWPDPDGKQRGQSLAPLYETAPKIAHNDKLMYELLSLIDTIRIGRVREANLAVKELEKRILQYEKQK